MACNKGIIFIISYWIFEIASRLGMYLRWENFQLTEKDSDNEYLYVIFMDISDLLAIFPTLLNICFFHRNNKIETEQNNPLTNDENENDSIVVNNTKLDIELNEEKSQKENAQQSEQSQEENKSSNNRFYEICKIILFLLFLALNCLLDLLARSSYFLYHCLFETDNEEVSQKFAHDFLIFVDISMRFFLYKIVYKSCKRHHIFCVISVIIIFSILIVFDTVYLHYSKKYEFHNCLYFISILLIRSIAFPIVDLVYKKFMAERFLFPWGYMFFRGLHEFFYLLILSLILLRTSVLHFTSNIFTTNFWIISSIYILVSFIKSSLLIYIVDKYSFTSVSFLIMSEPLSDSIYEIINFIIKDEKNTLTIFKVSAEIILFLLLILVSLFYDEIIVIRICGLDRDTNEAIRKRAEEDITLEHKSTLELE